MDSKDSYRTAPNLQQPGVQLRAPLIGRFTPPSTALRKGQLQALLGQISIFILVLPFGRKHLVYGLGAKT